MVIKQDILKEVERIFKQVMPSFNTLAENGIYKNPLDKYCLVTYPPRSALKPSNPDQKTKIMNLFASFPGNLEIDMYIHIPFCSRACTFCNFYFEPGIQNCKEKIDSYLNALEREANYLAKSIKNKLTIRSLYIGGGTPSLLDLEQIKRVLSLIFENYKCKPFMEITLELHPEIIRIKKDLEKYLQKLKGVGFTRLSIGQQSTDKKILAKYHRGHNINEIQHFFQEAKKVGFNLNVDLMLGFLDQTLESYHKTLSFVAGLDPDMITTYFMEIRPNSTEFENYKKAMTSKEFRERLIKLSILNTLFLEKAGYSERTFSYWFKKSSDFEHRKKKWGGDESILLSLGPGTYNWIFTKLQENVVFYKPFDIQAYQEGVDKEGYPIERAIIMNEEETLRRHFMFYIRQGIIKSERIERISSQELKKEIEMLLRGLVNLGLVEPVNSDFKLTMAGRVLKHEIADVFASDDILTRAATNRGVEEQKYEWFTNPFMLQKFKKVISQNSEK